MQYQEEDDIVNREGPSQSALIQSRKFVYAQTMEDQKKCVRQMARMALFTNGPIKKEEFCKKALLGRFGRGFYAFLDQVNTYLEQVFGMKLVELPLNETKKGAIVLKRGVYILISILKDADRESYIDMNQEGKWQTTLTIILSLIFANGSSISEDHLLALLDDLELKDESFPGYASNMDEFLKLAVKRMYLVKSLGADKETNMYSWGPRAKIEFPQSNMIKFISDIHKENQENAGDRLERDLERMSQMME